MPRQSPDTLRATIAQLQRQLASIEKRQVAMRAEAIEFMRGALSRLGVSIDELAAAAGAPTARKKATGKKATGKRATAKRATGKKATAKKATAKRATGRKATGTKSTGKRTTPVRGKARGKGARTVPAKFRSPEGEEWSGRGRTPRWLTALLSAGRSAEEFRIHPASAD